MIDCVSSYNEESVSVGSGVRWWHVRVDVRNI